VAERKREKRISARQWVTAPACRYSGAWFVRKFFLLDEDLHASSIPERTYLRRYVAEK
jgi:hypothetical protein